MHFQRLLLLSLLPTQKKSIENGRCLVSELRKNCPAPLFMTTKWARAKFCEEFAPHLGGTNDNGDHACERNNITVQNKIIAKILPLNRFTTLKFLSLLPSMNGYFFSWLLCFALQYMFIQVGSQTRASLSLVPPGWGANSSQSCRSCSFSGHKQRCWTVLSEPLYKVAYNPNTFFLNWKQRTTEKPLRMHCNTSKCM